MAAYQRTKKHGSAALVVTLLRNEPLCASEVQRLEACGNMPFLHLRIRKRFGRTELESVERVGESLLERLRRPVTQKELLACLAQAVDANRAAVDAGLQSTHIVWSLDAVFWQANQWRFLYLPLDDRQTECDPIAFFKELLEFAEVSEDDETDHETMSAQAAVPRACLDPADEMDEANETELFFSECHAADWMDAGTDQEAVPQASLLRVKTGEVILLAKSPFRVGSSKRQCDYRITGNPTISRCHAVFSYENGSWCVTDRNSKNHTYWNGRQITEGERAVLLDQDRIRLSDETFVIRLEQNEKEG